MRKYFILFSSVVLFGCVNLPSGKHLGFGSGPYLGESPPGEKVVKFPFPAQKGFFPSERVAISPDGMEIYYTEMNGWAGYDVVTSKSRVNYFQMIDNEWKGPFTVFEDFNSPCLSPDGQTLFIQDYNSYPWISVREPEGWSLPQKFKTTMSIHYLQPTGLGNLYGLTASQDTIGGKDWCIVQEGNSVMSPRTLGSPPNNAKDQSDYVMAKDESFIIVAVDSGSGRYLAITFRTRDGQWSEPLNLGPQVNAFQWIWGPSLSPDEKFLFYSTGTSKANYGIYWIKIDDIIKMMRPQK